MDLDQEQYQHRFRGESGLLTAYLDHRIAKAQARVGPPPSEVLEKIDTPPEPEPVGLGDRWLWHDDIHGWYLTAGLDTAARARRLQMGIPRLYQDFRLSNFKPVNDKQRSCLEMVDKWVIDNRHHKRQPKKENHSLLITGGTGTGKTHLAVGAIIEMLGSNFRPYFVDARDLLENLRSSFTRDGHNPISEYIQFEALLIDDLGANEKITPIQKDRFCQIITARINDMSPTIITSNHLFPMDWQAYVDDRVTSRIYEAYKLIQWGSTMPDWRIAPPEKESDQEDLPF